MMDCFHLCFPLLFHEFTARYICLFFVASTQRWRCHCGKDLYDHDDRNRGDNARQMRKFMKGHYGLRPGESVSLNEQQLDHLRWAITGGKFCPLNHVEAGQDGSHHPRHRHSPYPLDLKRSTSVFDDYCLIDVSMELVQRDVHGKWRQKSKPHGTDVLKIKGVFCDYVDIDSCYISCGKFIGKSLFSPLC